MVENLVGNIASFAIASGAYLSMFLIAPILKHGRVSMVATAQPAVLIFVCLGSRSNLNHFIILTPQFCDVHNGDQTISVAQSTQYNTYFKFSAQGLYNTGLER